MRTIAHISDLHFGTEQPELAEALRAELVAVPPSLLVVSGDLTQRARRRQFAAAQAYLDPARAAVDRTGQPRRAAVRRRAASARAARCVSVGTSPPRSTRCTRTGNSSWRGSTPRAR